MSNEFNPDPDVPTFQNCADKTTWEVQQAISTISDEPSQIDAIASIRGWFGNPEQDKDEHEALSGYLNGDLSLEEAQKKSISPSTIFHAAKKGSQNHDKLASLLKSFENKDPIYSSAREAFNDSPGSNAGYSLPETHAWTHLNSFLAHLTKLGQFDFWIYSIWTLRSALECRNPGPQVIEPSTKTQYWDAMIPAAGAWIQVLGLELVEKDEDLTPQRQGVGNPARGGELYKGRAGFGRERWELWKRRFGEIGKAEGVSEETRRVTGETVGRMEKADKSG
ncbi:hypothetical protein GQ43DRAFT_444378 [Delitschia confertaspora ATCC 74209]|uniref:Uncharacterized protein n=1 Tax=Delitschia confertaspora ATCC 74209 TaxID=1513339 RepID=A0A9P4JD75_9PLEO|nr:hypothetical protein GQ43DRAFT_444378 [Delitschia confertaspora ATCC 74209]